MHENAARALQYYEDLPRRSGRPDLRLVETEPRTARRLEAEAHARGDEHAEAVDGHAEPRRAEPRRAEARRPEQRRRPEPAARRRHEAPAPRRPLIPARRRQTVAPRIAGRPDRVAMWAVMLGFFLTGVAAATGHG